MLRSGIVASTPVAPVARRGSLVVVNVATPSKNPAQRLPKRSKVEIIKEKSDFLRHPLMEELVNDNTFISEEAVQLMKFHGSYMQDHREMRAPGKGKAYMFMMRTRQPGGAVTNQLYLAMDELADKVRNTPAVHLHFSLSFLQLHRQQRMLSFFRSMAMEHCVLPHVNATSFTAC